MISSRREMFGLAAGALAAGGGAVATPAVAAQSAAASDERFVASLLGRDMLLWTPMVQMDAYRNFDKIFATSKIRRGGSVSEIPRVSGFTPGPYLEDGKTETLDDFMRTEHIAGMLILKNGALRYERYAQGLQPHELWNSMSMVKSITSTLVGCAVHDKILLGLDEPCEKYVPTLKGTAYEGVTLKQLMQMSSGVAWDETYIDPNADVNIGYLKVIADRKRGGILEHLTTLKRIHPPGAHFAYNTADTYVAGCILRKALGGSIADYFSERIWSRIGAERDANFMLESDDGQEVAGSCGSFAPRDYARFALFTLSGGVAGGRQVLPSGWMEEATRPSAPREGPAGYGYFWWINPDRTFTAQGYLGQTMYFDPKNQLAVVLLSTVPAIPFRKPGESSQTRREAFFAEVTRSLS